MSYAKGAKGQRTAKIEYFDDKGLENFFLNRPKENNGIVQKFEEPTSPYNTLLRAYWTPHKLQLQQRVNKHELSDGRVVMNDRLSTFDGPEHLNVEFDIKSYKLKMRLMECVNSIVEHIRMLLPSAYTLWTMECFFKLSGKNKLLFLWCNDLRVFNTNGMFRGTSRIGHTHAHNSHALAHTTTCGTHNYFWKTDHNTIGAFPKITTIFSRSAAIQSFRPPLLTYLRYSQT